MTRVELFKKYHITEFHSAWEPIIDNWVSVELYRIMHDGKLPPKDDLSIVWVIKFLDKMKNPQWLSKMREEYPNNSWGSLYLTAKRMVYQHAEQILSEIGPAGGEG